MRRLMLVALFLVLPGCATEAPPETAAAVADGGDVIRAGAATVREDFAGSYMLLTSVHEPSSTRSDFFREGDEGAQVDEGATSLTATASVTGATPTDWELCMSPADPHAGVCAKGSGMLEVTADATQLAETGLWRVWFSVAEGALPANAGAAMQVDWSAHVDYEQSGAEAVAEASATA